VIWPISVKCAQVPLGAKDHFPSPIVRHKMAKSLQRGEPPLDGGLVGQGPLPYFFASSSLRISLERFWPARRYSKRTIGFLAQSCPSIPRPDGGAL
jgi:hypothetical protein